MSLKIHPAYPLTAALILLAPAARADEAKPIELGSTQVVQPVREWTAEDSTTVNFIKGGSALSEAENLNLKALYQKAAHGSGISRILVIAWADKEGLKDNEKATQAQITLAQKRAEAIKQLMVELSNKPVHSVNMASDAGWIAKTFHTRDAVIKDAVKFPNAAPDQGKALAEMLEQQGGLGKAVVILEREANPGNKAVGL